MLLRENIRQLWGFNRGGTLIFLRPQCPITRTHLRQRETESYNILNCSNNKTKYGNGLFCHNKWVAKRQGHRNLEFHIVHLLKPAPQTQTATAHLQTTWTVYFDGQGTQKLPCGKIPRGGGGGGGIGWLMVYVCFHEVQLITWYQVKIDKCFCKIRRTTWRMNEYNFILTQRYSHFNLFGFVILGIHIQSLNRHLQVVLDTIWCTWHWKTLFSVSEAE